MKKMTSKINQIFKHEKNDLVDALIMPTIDPFIQDKWDKTKGVSTPQFNQVEYVYHNQEFTVLIILKNYGVQDNLVSIKYAYKIEKDTGEMVDEGEAIAYKNKIDQRQFLLCQSLPKIRFDDDSKAGKYTIHLKFSDEITGKENTLSCDIELKNFQTKSTVNTEDELEEWVTSYYLKPKPDEMIDAFLYFIKTISDEDQYINGIGFFKECLNLSPFLIPELVSLYEEINNPAIRKGFLILVGNSHYPQAIADKIVNEKDKELLGRIINGILPDSLHSDLTDPQELDFLWSAFFANGRYENIEKLIYTLEFRDALGNMSDGEAATEKESQVMREAIYAAAKWSLQANAQSHEFVKIYCTYFLNYEKSSKELKNDLLEIIN